MEVKIKWFYEETPKESERCLIAFVNAYGKHEVSTGMLYGGKWVADNGVRILFIPYAWAFFPFAPAEKKDLKLCSRCRKNSSGNILPCAFEYGIGVEDPKVCNCCAECRNDCILDV